MSVRKLRNAWWVDFRFEGKRYRKRSPMNSKTGADDYEATLRQRLVARGTIEPKKEAEQTERKKFKVFA